MASHFSFVDEIAEILSISNDSAYRRIRGEKPISLDEAQVLCSKYQVSLDQLLHIKTNTVIFSYDKVDDSSFVFTKYLQFIAHSLELFSRLQNPQMYFYSKDLPPYLFTPFPQLMAFKFFFWKRTLLGYADLSKQRFNGDEPDTETIEIANRIDELYAKIPSTDIWNEESINVTISQIEFYRQANIFTDKDIVIKIYSQLEDLVNHLELQAETGKKSQYHKPDVRTNVLYDVYINETLIGDNTVYIQSDNRQMTFINHSGLNFMQTQDQDFCDITFKHLQNVIRKSTHISVVGEKERSMFFNNLRHKIQERKKTVN